MFTLHNLGHTPSIAAVYLSQLRDVTRQRHRANFRNNLYRLGQIMAFEISKTMTLEEGRLHTPLAAATDWKLAPPVLITILRAGLPFYHGFQDIFDEAEAGFIGAYRKEGKDFDIVLSYEALPDVTNRVVMMIDPMLATGKSLARTLQAVMVNGNPAHVHVATLLAAPEGIAHLKKEINLPWSLWTFAVDERLDENFYIVPGLGDAGDLSYGEKKKM
jgi:uracil phosphoribosyltransferase